MALQIGIIGLPNVGKSTLFNALTRSKGAMVANYPFCTIDPNVGVVTVPDVRLQTLVELVKPEKVIPAAIEFKDIAGLVRGAHKGEGLGNQFLAHIREVDALCEVVRFFADLNVTHVEGDTNPKRDREIIDAELAIADLETIEKRIEKIARAAKSGDKEKQKELSVYEKVRSTLSSGGRAIDVSLHEEERAILRKAQLLTDKPILYACNVAEGELKTLSVSEAVVALGVLNPSSIIRVSAKIEEELRDLSPEDAKAFLSELGVTTSGLDQLIQSAYDALGYITFFTAGPKEVRAWNVRRGSTAPEAAGVIHTDFQKGFIRAETIAYEDYVLHGGEQGAKVAGKMRAEGKEYVICDGDVLHFRFNV